MTATMGRVHFKNQGYQVSYLRLLKVQKTNSFPTMNFFLSALGLMMVFEGIPYFCFPQKVKLFAQKLPEIPDSTMRVIGFFLMMMGLLVVYLGGGKNG
tara:strand:+ start:360 stop:653 length:294 start_codon:yes stop_codon:yes gene_type:complete